MIEISSPPPKIFLKSVLPRFGELYPYFSPNKGIKCIFATEKQDDRYMKELIIGRKAEQEVLQEAFESDKSEFIAICGRRRVGKTFLVKRIFWKT